MNEFRSGKREGYIYGYLFLSGNKGLVLDEGPNEYPVDSAELLIDGEYVLVENLKSLDVKKINGSKARIKDLKKSLYFSDEAHDQNINNKY